MIHTIQRLANINLETPPTINFLPLNSNTKMPPKTNF